MDELGQVRSGPINRLPYAIVDPNPFMRRGVFDVCDGERETQFREVSRPYTSQPTRYTSSYYPRARLTSCQTLFIRKHGIRWTYNHAGQSRSIVEAHHTTSLGLIFRKALARTSPAAFGLERATVGGPVGEGVRRGPATLGQHLHSSGLAPRAVARRPTAIGQICQRWPPLWARHANPASAEPYRASEFAEETKIR